tara:strand:+ start:4901 stop:5056 length:156 start_codon:yes stop_codon:yes gene_type:complete
MTQENYEAIDKALNFAEQQLERIVFTGDHERAKEIAVDLLHARVALLDEAR